MSELTLVSWNVNGLRAADKKGFRTYFEQKNADIFCLQETKLSEGQFDFNPEGYHSYYSYSTARKGYSGTALFSKEAPLSVTYGIGSPLDDEGRTILAEYDHFFVICVYTPNSQDELKRLDQRLMWDAAFRNRLKELDDSKPILACGDFNVAHTSIDLKNPKPNEGHAGYSKEERDSFTTLLEEGFCDSFRYLYPTVEHRYSWWSYRFKAREKNAGWRIDYWLTSDRIKDKIKESEIDDTVMGSDHAPIYLKIDM
ncbi:MAG: exodeoxyribonuclease III [Spirochaetia bacterium]|jgi:exodeoxyribonuclease-3|nr:exodeoxyribonuclease III [Spirochaetia bacterium]